MPDKRCPLFNEERTSAVANGRIDREQSRLAVDELIDVLGRASVEAVGLVCVRGVCGSRRRSPGAGLRSDGAGRKTCQPRAGDSAAWGVHASIGTCCWRRPRLWGSKSSVSAEAIEASEEELKKCEGR